MSSKNKHLLLWLLGLSLFVHYGCNRPTTPKADEVKQSLRYDTQNEIYEDPKAYQCEELIKERAYEAAYAGCLYKAKSGDAQAQLTVGQLFIQGRLGNADWEQGLHWILKAAEQGVPEAQYLVAKSYEQGQGLNKDNAAAFTWLSLAAKANYIPAQTLLGEFYLEGKGTPKDYNIARQWLTHSAKASDANAHYLLGRIYVEGLGVNKNVYLGERYLLQAAEQNVMLAQKELARLYQEGIDIPRNEAVAYKWYLAAASQGDPQSLTVVGMSLISGTNEQQNIEKGASYLKQASDKGYYPAQYALASLYLEGHPVLTDKFTAIEYLRKAAVGGSTDAQIKLAKILAEFAVPQYDKVAFYWMSQASSKNMDAQYQLGCYYIDGIGTDIDYDRALQIFTQLATQNHHEAELKLGQMYYYGHGVDKDSVAAKKWFLRSARSGLPDAKNWVAILFRDGIEDIENTQTKDEFSEWIRYEADNGQPQAIYMKGMNHLYGRHNFAQNVEYGLELIEQAANTGFVQAQRELGMIYEQGLFGLSSIDKAYPWYLKASQNGDGYAQYRLAHMFYMGDGVPKNDIQSYAWANLAVLSGREEASALRDEISQSLKSSDLQKAREMSDKYFKAHTKSTSTSQSEGFPLSMDMH